MTLHLTLSSVLSLYLRMLRRCWLRLLTRVEGHWKARRQLDHLSCLADQRTKVCGLICAPKMKCRTKLPSHERRQSRLRILCRLRKREAQVIAKSFSRPIKWSVDSRRSLKDKSSPRWVSLKSVSSAKELVQAISWQRAKVKHRSISSSLLIRTRRWAKELCLRLIALKTKTRQPMTCTIKSRLTKLLDEPNHWYHQNQKVTSSESKLRNSNRIHKTSKMTSMRFSKRRWTNWQTNNTMLIASQMCT